MRCTVVYRPSAPPGRECASARPPESALLHLVALSDSVFLVPPCWFLARNALCASFQSHIIHLLFTQSPRLPSISIQSRTLGASRTTSSLRSSLLTTSSLLSPPCSLPSYCPRISRPHPVRPGCVPRRCRNPPRQPSSHPPHSQSPPPCKVLSRLSAVPPPFAAPYPYALLHTLSMSLYPSACIPQHRRLCPHLQAAAARLSALLPV